MTKDDGLKRMDELKVGEYILGQEDESCKLVSEKNSEHCLNSQGEKWVRVVDWLHHDSESLAMYSKVYFSDEAYFHATAYHLLAVQEQG